MISTAHLAQSGTDGELNKALVRSENDTAHGPVEAQYADVKNQHRTGQTCTLSTREALTKATFPKTGH